MTTRRAQVLAYFEALERADVETALALAHEALDVPDRLDGGGRIVGKAAVRAYWKRGFDLVRVSNTVLKASPSGDDAIRVVVAHSVKSLDGRPWGDSTLTYRISFRDNLIWRIDEITG